MSLLPIKKIFGIFAMNWLKKQISKVFIIRRAENSYSVGSVFFFFSLHFPSPFLKKRR